MSILLDENRRLGKGDLTAAIERKHAAQLERYRELARDMDSMDAGIARKHERLNGPPKTDGELLAERCDGIVIDAELTRCKICKQQCDTMAGLVVHVAKHGGRAQ